jgi:hypothetical protein
LVRAQSKNLQDFAKTRETRNLANQFPDSDLAIDRPEYASSAGRSRSMR